MNNSRAIKRHWISISEKGINKFNEALRLAVADWTGEVPADSRGAEDTGNEPELIDNNK